MLLFSKEVYIEALKTVAKNPTTKGLAIIKTQEKFDSGELTAIELQPVVDIIQPPEL